MITLTEDISGQLIGSNSGKNIIMIGEEYCKYCNAIKPFFETMSTIYTDINFYYLKSSLATEISKHVEYEGIPTLISIVRGRILESKEGGDVDTIISLIDNVVAS